MICTFIIEPTFAFLGLGHFLLNLSDPIKVDLFILVSILLSFALLPILLSISDAPDVINPKKFSLKELFVISPLGFIGAFFTGLAHSVILGYGAVYATSKGLDLFQISIFMVIVTSFGAIFQWPIGYLSDKIDRRLILIGVTFLASGLCVLIVISSYFSIIIFFIILAIYSGMSLPMYSLVISHTNDFLEQDQIVSAVAAIGILVSFGSICGPIIASIFMNLIGADGFFIYLFIVHVLLGFFGLYRLAKRAKPSTLESQYTSIPRNITAAGMEMTPIVEPSDE